MDNKTKNKTAIKIIKSVAQKYGFSPEVLTEANPRMMLSKARREAARRLKEEVGLSYREIANLLGLKEGVVVYQWFWRDKRKKGNKLSKIRNKLLKYIPK